MKPNKIFGWLGISLMMLSASALTSCEDQPDKFELTGGTPTINYVRMPYLSQADSLITEANLKTTICLVGNNLTSIKKMLFNDQEAQLNTSYITDHTLLVQVPEKIPAKVDDKIFMITKDQDTVSYDFHVVVPAPLVNTMSCEYAKAGEDVTIYGNYFIDDPNVPLTVTMPDGQQVRQFSSIAQSAITFTMPDCKTEGPIEVTSIYGTTKSAFHYNESRGLLFNFDTPWDGVNVLGNHGWHNRDIISDETSLSGNFVQLGNGSATMSEDGGWDDSNFSFEYWCGSWDTPQKMTSGDGVALNQLVDFKNFKNMALKFEMYIPTSNPWCAGAMQIAFEGYDLVTLSGNPIDGYSGTVAGANAKIFNGDDGKGDWGRAMYRPWTTTGSYDTGNKWVTVTIPLSSMTLDSKGATTDKGPSTAADFASLTIFVTGGGINGKECKPIIKIDNIRVVPNK